MGNTMIEDAYDWIAKSFIAGCVAVIAFFTKRVVSDVTELKKDSADCKLNLANYKTEVSNTYSKETSTQASLSRIHDRMDKIGEDFQSGLHEIRADIKALIAKVK